MWLLVLKRCWLALGALTIPSALPCLQINPEKHWLPTDFEMGRDSPVTWFELAGDEKKKWEQ
jgi:hypothetical protein